MRRLTLPASRGWPLWPSRCRGNSSRTNNRAETAVRVEDGAIRVLYLDGGIRPEGKYLARALGEAAEIALDRRILVGGPVAQPPSAGQPSTAEGGGATPAEIEKFDLVVLGDLAASSLDPAVIARIAERVAAGRLNLLVLGGLIAYGAGGWADTPAGQGPAGRYPHRATANCRGRWRFVPRRPRRALHLCRRRRRADELRRPAAAGGANAVGPLDPSARLLAQSADGRPLLAVRQFGPSRVAAFMADTTYQWVLAPAETRGADVHRRFWRQLALWAAGRDGRPQTDFWVTTDRPHYVLVDPDSAPVAEVTVHASGTAAAAQPTLVLARPRRSVRPGGPWSAARAMTAGPSSPCTPPACTA